MRHLNAQRAQLASAMTTIPDSANGLLVTAPESVRERYRGLRGGCVCSIESGPCERVESLQMSGRF